MVGRSKPLPKKLGKPGQKDLTLLPDCESLGGDVVVLEDVEPKEFEQEFAQDVVALIASFSARLYGRRGGRKKKAAE